MSSGGVSRPHFPQLVGVRLRLSPHVLGVLRRSVAVRLQAEETRIRWRGREALNLNTDLGAHPMVMPTQRQVEIPLLQEVEARGGQARPKDLYARIAAHFPELTQEEMEEVFPDNPSNRRWDNQVQWARQRLIGKGELISPKRGLWAITQKGRERLRAEGQLDAGRTPVADVRTLEELVEEHEAALRDRLLTLVKELDPYAFERFAKRLLEALGFSKVTVTSKSHDGGIDGHGQYRQGIVAVKAAFQCKRWQGVVPRPELDKFRGAVVGSYDLGVFITTSGFSKEAQGASVKPGAITIVLVDGRAVADLMVRYEIGLRRRVMNLATVDEAFFESLSEKEPLE